MRLAVAFAAFVGWGCGGATSSAPQQAPVAAPSVVTVYRAPIEIAVEAQRFGESVRLDVEGIGRGVPEGEAFEDPQRWVISARAGQLELARLVNGPVRVARNPVGGATSAQWDTVVQFSVVYRMPRDVSEIAVRVEPPSSQPVVRVLTL